tara:strand:+ start:1908 stop:2537 length:630 start_codon:yes stop_codon:yes gene_type:complete
MVYKNLIYRLLLSIFFFLIFFVAINNKYLLFILGTFIYLFVFYEILKFFKFFNKIILIYLFFSYFCFSLYFFVFFDFYIFYLFVFTIIFFDSFSYFTGKLFGKNYIFETISPKKTAEGYIGGIFFTNVFSICFLYFTNIRIEFGASIILLNLIIFTSAIGDLMESYFKRINNIKDSSAYIPGHGGFFDRFDSFIASVIFLSLYSFFINL